MYFLNSIINKFNLDIIKVQKFINFFFPRIIRRKINKEFFNLYYLPSALKTLPQTNYQHEFDYNYQKELIIKFKLENKQTSFMTCPNLIELLLMKFERDQEFSFLDIGGEKIDFYLDLKKNFKNIKYYIFNQKKLLDVFVNLKSNFSITNLNIISEISEIYNNQYDFINFGSCIQYLNNYEEILDKVTNKENRYFFFSGMPNYTSDKEVYKKDMIVRQVNCMPQTDHLYFINKIYFYDIFIKKNYTLLFEQKNLTDNVNFKNFNDIVKTAQYTDVMFKKNNS